MNKDNLKKAKLPDKPGVYQFHDAKGWIMYIGKATSLRGRVRSYFSNDLMHTRGKHIVDMVTLASSITFTATDSELEALVLEASLIKRNQPYYNTREKDNKSWNYVVVTKEEFPRVLTIRERTMFVDPKTDDGIYQHIFGPFTQGTTLAVALKIIRRIFPYRDTCTPFTAQEGTSKGKPCFNRQIGLCPGVCTGEISKTDYKERIKEIRYFFEGKKALLLTHLKKTMQAHAKIHEFEIANEYKHMIFSLGHIKDSSLISEDVRAHSQKTSSQRAKPFRIEAYDIAHISGKYTVGVMVVLEDGVPKKSDYRKFKIRIDSEKSNDTLHLEEVLMRRFAHTEWMHPDLLVIDGGLAQKRRAEKVMKDKSMSALVVSVVKDARHKPKAILGHKETAISYKRWILIANAESHRFALAYHQHLRERIPR